MERTNIFPFFEKEKHCSISAFQIFFKTSSFRHIPKIHAPQQSTRREASINTIENQSSIYTTNSLLYQLMKRALVLLLYIEAIDNTATANVLYSIVLNHYCIFKSFKKSSVDYSTAIVVSIAFYGINN